MDPTDPANLVNVTTDGVAHRTTLKDQIAASKKVTPNTVVNVQREKRLQEQAQDKKTGGGAPRAPQLTKADADRLREEAEYEERQRLLDKVMKYRERFPKLKKRNGTLTIKSSLAELYDECHFIEDQLGRDDFTPGGSTLKPANMALIGTMHGLEIGSQHFNPLNLNLTGLGATTQASIKQFEPLLDEFCIKNNLNMSASVEFRICAMIVTTVVSVHMANSGQGEELMAKFGGNTAKEVSGDTKDL